MSAITKPMLAGKVEDTSKLSYPVVASPKLDGIRCVVLGGKALARSLKPIPNAYIRKRLEAIAPEGIDGEIMAGTTFQECTSGVMKMSGEPMFTFWAFDIVTDTEGCEKPYVKRLEDLKAAVAKAGSRHIKVVPTKVINTSEELLTFEAECLAQGFEGVMVRHPDGPYKCGRSTEREGWLLKLKRFADAEARITGFEELMRNENEATINELGHTKRSSAKAGKVPGGTLGKFIAIGVQGQFEGVELRIGTGEGLTASLRQEIWDNRPSYLGKIVKYRYQPVGVKDAPRIPIWIGFRDEIDT